MPTAQTAMPARNHFHPEFDSATGGSTGFISGAAILNRSDSGGKE